MKVSTSDYISYGYEHSKSNYLTSGQYDDHFYNLVGIHFGKHVFSPSTSYNVEGPTDLSEIQDTGTFNQLFIKISQ